MGHTSKKKKDKSKVQKSVLKRTSKCAICLGKLRSRTVSTIGCRHNYCFDCIKQWSNTRNTCPQCVQPFTTIRRICNGETHRVSPPANTSDRDLDNSYGFYSQLLHLFFTCRLFRCRIELGIIEHQRGPLAIFLILKDVVQQLRRHGLMPPSVDDTNFEEAHTWMDRVNSLIGDLRLVAVESNATSLKNKKLLCAVMCVSSICWGSFFVSVQRLLPLRS